MMNGASKGSSMLQPYEIESVEWANASGRRPLVFVHGLWLLSTSWEPWAALFDSAGFAPLMPGWPDDPASVAAANEAPEAFANKSIRDVAEHFTAVIKGLHVKPVVLGHSFGGLIAQMLAGQGLAAATIAISPAPFRGVLPLPFAALRSAWPVLRNVHNRHRAVPLSYDEFRYAFANALEEVEAAELYRLFAVPGSGEPVFQAAAANLNPWTEDQVNTQRGDRGPLLIISGASDHTVPPDIAKASYERQRKNPGVTEFGSLPNRGHSLTIDHGWREVAAMAQRFLLAQRISGSVSMEAQSHG